MPTTQIEFTWDEGQTWSTLQISSFPMIVENIIIEPNSISQQFLLYGVAAPAEGGEEQEKNVSGNKAILTYLDFSSLHVRECEGVYAAQYGYGESDYELWSPHDGRHGTSNNCFLGQHVTYERRKQDAECHNGEAYDRVITRTNCECTDLDYECDFGYVRAA